MYPIAFLFSLSNSVYEAQRHTSLLSSPLVSPSDISKGCLQGNCVPMYLGQRENLRRALILFCARGLSQHNWISDQDRFIGEQ
jgi:hypothetical protein